ncbi:hypothetical protein Tco_1109489 [Tanacetum coccineum]
MAKLNGENVSLNIIIESLVQERENIKLEYQKLFNLIKATRVQHQREVDELIENVNQKTYSYGDVHSKNQDLLMTISDLKAKLKNAEKRKNVNTKLEKSATLEKLICVTPLNKNKDLKAKIVSKVEIKKDESKPVTSYSKPKNEQDKKKNVNVIARGMYRVIKTETQTPVAKSKMFSSKFTGVASSSSVKRPDSKDNNLKKKVLLHTKSKSTSKDVKKSHSSVSLVSNKHDTLNSNISKSNANVLKVKLVNAVNDGSNLVCVSCGKYVFMISHDKCVARYALSVNSRMKRALFTSLVTAKSSKLGATPVVVIQIVLWIVYKDLIFLKYENIEEKSTVVDPTLKRLMAQKDVQDQERVHDFQLGIESYQIKINLTVPKLIIHGIEECDPFSIVAKPTTGLIYLNNKNEKRFMDLEELSKFCDATLEKVLKEVKIKIFET